MAAFIPLIAGLLPDVIKLVTSLAHPAVKEAETLGPGTGPVKLAQVFEIVKSGLQSALIAKTVTDPLPSDDLIKIVIQAVVNALQLEGALGITSTPSVSATGSQALTLKAGQGVSITGQNVTITVAG